MILIETSVLVTILRDGSGASARALLELAGDREIVFTRLTELELLVGARDEKDWAQLRAYLSERKLLEPGSQTWADAARIYFDLRRKGQTIRSLIDCCIAQVALDHDILLIHNDRDFEAIAELRPLKQQRVAGFESSAVG